MEMCIRDSLYMLPVHSAGDAAGAYMMETATTAVQESRHDLVLEVSANSCLLYTSFGKQIQIVI